MEVGALVVAHVDAPPHPVKRRVQQPGVDHPLLQGRRGKWGIANGRKAHMHHSSEQQPGVDHPHLQGGGASGRFPHEKTAPACNAHREQQAGVGCASELVELAA